MKERRGKVQNGRKYLQIIYFKGPVSEIYVGKKLLLLNDKKKKNPV